VFCQGNEPVTVDVTTLEQGIRFALWFFEDDLSYRPGGTGETRAGGGNAGHDARSRWRAEGMCCVSVGKQHATHGLTFGVRCLRKTGRPVKGCVTATQVISNNEHQVWLFCSLYRGDGEQVTSD